MIHISKACDCFARLKQWFHRTANLTQNALCWARTSQPGAAKHLPRWFKYVWQILADIIPSQVTSVCQSAQNWHKYHIVCSGYFNRNVIVCLGQIWIQHAQGGAPAVPKSRINEAGSRAMGISCMLWILRSGGSLWKWLFQNNRERPYYYFFFSGVTKLFPLFPIILAFANTGSALLFAALVLSAQTVLEQPVPLLPITAFVQCSYASLLKDAGRASRWLHCCENSVPYANCCLNSKM